MQFNKNLRDHRLTQLSQEEVEPLAHELYLALEQRRSWGDGYYEMGDIANEIILKYLPPQKR
jgi:hypothetical protein